PYFTYYYNCTTKLPVIFWTGVNSLKHSSSLSCTLRREPAGSGVAVHPFNRIARTPIFPSLSGQCFQPILKESIKKTGRGEKNYDGSIILLP
ncbi:MAG: hypothetical protein ACKPGW_28195, partial [Microcystis panniformis]